MTLPENVKCPKCGGDMISRKGKFGIFWGCKKYPECTGTRDSMGRSKDEREKELSDDRDRERDEQNGPSRFPFRKN